MPDSTPTPRCGDVYDPDGRPDEKEISVSTDHYAEAEGRLRNAAYMAAHFPEHETRQPAVMVEVAAAQVHATLALTDAVRALNAEATFPAPRVSIRPDGGVIRALLMSDAPLSEADTLRAAAQRFAITAQAHRDISGDDPAAQQVSSAYQEAADVLAHWAESGRVPRLGPNGRAKWRGAGEEVAGG